MILHESNNTKNENQNEATDTNVLYGKLKWIVAAEIETTIETKIELKIKTKFDTIIESKITKWKCKRESKQNNNENTQTKSHDQFSNGYFPAAESGQRQGWVKNIFRNTVAKLTLNCVKTNRDGTKQAGEFEGMMRYDARVAVEKSLDEKGLLRGKEPHKMRLGLCSRSGDIIEPMITPQWWVLQSRTIPVVFCLFFGVIGTCFMTEIVAIMG